MILFNLDDFLFHKDKFVCASDHENSWLNFTQQYGNVVRLLNQTAMNGEYRLNGMSYPYLFLLRHYCELQLKSVLYERGIEIPKSHDFTDIFTLIPDLPIDLVSALQIINLDNDGSCYRYFYDKSGKVAIPDPKKEFVSFYRRLIQVSKDNPFYLHLNITPPFSNLLKDELTFHFSEVTSPAVFRSYYDSVTQFLLVNVIENKIGVDNIYLALLFLIRHSLELVLKEGLLGMIHTQPEEAHKKINRLLNNEHKLSQLFRCYLELIPEDGISRLPLEFQHQYYCFKFKAEKLKESIHSIDTNSRYFRFPFDPETDHLNITSETLINITSVFLEVDAFLTFNIDVLKQYGAISYSSQELISLMGYNLYDIN